MARHRSDNQVAEAGRWSVRAGRKVTPTAANLLTLLISYTDLETGICYPKRTTLAVDLYDTDVPSKAQLNTISALIGDLCAVGLMTREQMTNKGKKTVNLYRLNVGAVPSNTGRDGSVITGHGDSADTGHGDSVITGHHRTSSRTSKGTSSRKRGRGQGHLRVVD